jgi:hypothetical protein
VFLLVPLLFFFFQIPLFFCGSYSTTATLIPSLGALVSSGTLIRCELIQVYHHHPRPRIPLDSVYHIVYVGDYPVWAFPRGLKFWQFPFRAGWAIEPHSVALLVTGRVFIRSLANFRFRRAKLWMSYSWSTNSAVKSVVGRSLSGGTPNSRSQGSRSSHPNTRLAGVNHVVS